VTPLRTDELADIAGSHRVAENHPTGHRDDLDGHVIRFVHHELDDVGDCFGNRVGRFRWLSLAERMGPASITTINKADVDRLMTELASRR